MPRLEISSSVSELYAILLDLNSLLVEVYNGVAVNTESRRVEQLINQSKPKHTFQYKVRTLNYNNLNIKFS
jgi:hypothetical protein